MRTRAALVLVNDPLLMGCMLRRHRGLLFEGVQGPASHVGACYYDGEAPVLLKEPALGRDSMRHLPERVLSRQFLSCAVTGAKTFRPKDTPPFRLGPWSLVSGGALWPAGQDPEALAIPLHLSRSVQGDTTSEQILHQFVSFLHGSPDTVPNTALRRVGDALRSTLSLDSQWFSVEGSRDLTLLLGDGRRAAGATLGRPLWFRHLSGTEPCDCGQGGDEEISHPGLRCTVVVDASESPGQDWSVIEQDRIFLIPRAGELEVISS